MMRPIEYIDKNTKENMKDEWFQNDSFSMKDQLSFFLYRKFLEI